MARQIANEQPANWITGHFDPLLAEHAAMVHAAAQPERLLIVEVTNPPAPLLPLRARAELVAALAEVSYVLMTDSETAASDAAITQRFIEEVHRRTNGAGK